MEKDSHFFSSTQVRGAAQRCVVHSKKYGLIGVGGTDLSILDPYLPPKYKIRAQCYVVVNQSVFKPTGELGTAA